MSLWLCLRFDQLPLQCLSRSEEHPVVVLARQRVVRANDCAAALGIREGMGSATVRALAGDETVQLLERDQGAEQRSLQQLCCWAYSITPSLYTWREDCLQLEIGGCLNLFQGLDALLSEVHSGIASRGYRVRYALAPTPRAAWLLSFAEDTATAIEHPLEQRLAPLPLALLAMHRLILSRRWIDVLWLGLAVAGIGLSRYQMLIMSAPLLLLAAFYWLWQEDEEQRRRTFVLLAAAGLALGLLLRLRLRQLVALLQVQAVLEVGPGVVALEVFPHLDEPALQLPLRGARGRRQRRHHRRLGVRCRGPRRACRCWAPGRRSATPAS